MALKEVMDVYEVAELIYGRVTKSTANMVRRRCANGTYRHATRAMNGCWRINAKKEWPELFGQEGGEGD